MNCESFRDSVPIRSRYSDGNPPLAPEACGAPADVQAKIRDQKQKRLGNRIESFPVLRFPSLGELLLDPGEDSNQALGNKAASRKEPVDRFRVAAEFVWDACEGRTGGLSTARRSKSRLAMGQVLRSSWWTLLVVILIVSNAAIVIWEPVATSASVGPDYIRYIELVLVVFLCIELVMMFYWLGFNRFIEKRWNIVYFVLLAAICIDLAIALIVHSVDKTVILVRWSRPLRLFLIICRVPPIRRSVVTIMKMLPKLFYLLLCIFCFFVGYSVVGMSLFKGMYKEGSYAPVQNFESLGSSMVALTVLFTTENFPDILVPVINKVPVESSIFFASFIVIAVWLAMNVLLAVVFEFYREEHKKKVSRSRSKEQHTLLLAYSLIKEADGSVGFKAFKSLMKYLKPRATDGELRALFQVLDANVSDDIAPREFTMISAILDYQVYRIDGNRNENVQLSSFERILRFGEPRLAKVVESRLFKRSIIAMLTANAIATGVLAAREDCGMSLRATSVSFLVLMVFEMIVKCGAHGLEHLVREEPFDLVVIILSIPFEAFLPGVWLAISRAVRFLRIITVVEGTAPFIRTFARCIGAFAELVCLVLTLFYFFALIGMETFSSAALRIPDHEDVESFDRFENAMLSMFQIATTNNWQDIMYPAVLDTDLSCASFFIVCFFTFNIVVLNLVAALVIEAYGIIVDQGDLSPIRDVIVRHPDSDQTESWRVVMRNDWSRALVSGDLPAYNEEEVSMLRQQVRELESRLSAIRLRKIEAENRRERAPPPPTCEFFNAML